jgi:D-3-phosphoglycerate dehydrogenase
MARELADGGVDAAGKVVGIVGMGAIGREVARLCHDGLRAVVLGNRRSGAPMPAHVTATPLEAMFRCADVVVLVCPLDDTTRGLVDERLLALMKPGAFLINASRGPVVDEPALIRALADGRLGGAALDVFQEQPLPPTSPLLALDNVILSPHMAGLTQDSMRRMGESSVDQTIQILNGQMPTYWVNPEAAAAIRARQQRLDPP